MKALKFTLFVTLASLLVPMAVSAATTDNNDAAARDQRIQGYTTSFPVKLTDKEKTQLLTTCVSAQGNLQKIYTHAADVETSRIKIYTSIDNRLDAVQKRLENQRLDTSVMDLLLTNYRQQLSTFSTSLATYRQVLQDASTMDCKANPAQFRSSVEAVRVARKGVTDNTTSIANTVTTDVKTSFDTVKKRIDEGSK